MQDQDKTNRTRGKSKHNFAHVRLGQAQTGLKYAIDET